MTTKSFEEAVAEKFRLKNAPTLFARRDAAKPIAFSRLLADESYRGTTMAAAAEEAFTFEIALGPMPSGEIWIDGRRNELPPALPGDVFLFDLATYPRANLKPPFNFLRFYLPLETLNYLACEQGARRVRGLRMPSISAPDWTMHALASSLLPALRSPASCSALFLDSVAIALSAHAMQRYGGLIPSIRANRIGLAPWQLRRVEDFIEAHLDADLSVAELARECRLSPSHFARSFGRSMGMPPHRWVMKKRIERAEELLLLGDLDLVQIAIVCGFFDQSHLNRVFTRFHGCGPAKWRRQRRH